MSASRIGDSVPAVREEHLVSFPYDRPIGRYFLYGEDGSHTEGSAVGVVRVPRGARLELELGDDLDSQLPQLEALGPTDLYALYIGSRDFTDSHAVHLRGLNCLTLLSLADTSIGDVGVEFLMGRLPGVRALDLTKTQITDVALESIGHHIRLESLNLWGTHITDRGLEELRRLRELKSLVLHGTKVTGPGMAHIGQIRSLELLDLWNVWVSDDEIAPLRKLKQLRHLDLWGTQITARGLGCLGTLPNLESLVLCGPAVSDASLAKLARFKALQALELHGLTDVGDGEPLPSVTDRGLRHLAAAKNLAAVRIVGTWATQSGVARLQEALPSCAVEWHPEADIRWFYRT